MRCLVFSLISLILVSSLQADVIHVPGDSTTIQGGINGASAGDTVLVAPGTYYEYSFRTASFLPPIDIAELFRREVLKAFVEQGLISNDVAENMLTWPHSGFNVHIGPRLFPDEGDSIGATLRYSARASISLQRLHCHPAMSHLPHRDEGHRRHHRR